MGVFIISIPVLLVSLTITNSIMGEFQQLTESSNRFAFKLYQDLRSDRGNMICSPYSLGILLSMVLEGSGGKTETEIATLINHSKNNENVLKSYQSIIKSMSSPALKIATRLFVEQGMKLNPNFTALTTHYFLSDVHKEDFIKNPENSRIDINNWAEEKTNHKIKDLLPSGSITDTTCLVLVNAIHFKANWKKRFNKNNTVDMPFYVTPTQTVDVPMMIMNEGRFRYTHSTKLNAKILEMPYEGDMFSMIIFLPNEIDGLNEMENKLKSINLNEELSSLDEITVNVIVPRFKIEKTLDLNDILKEKIPSAFTNANFSGITEDPIQISKVLQKAFIEVNEEGTEAAVATACVMRMRRAIIEEPPTVNCNHPFALFIIHGSTGLVLFESRFVNLPSSSATHQASTHEEL